MSWEDCFESQSDQDPYATQIYGVTEQTLEERSEIGYHERVLISRAQFKCLQQVRDVMISLWILPACRE